ncbi:membrane dipeptidase [Candidatus Wolfebacteria bacterium]|nr:membrane dipeptidase [Candidatus Wolfebacteria bacterium]
MSERKRRKERLGNSANVDLLGFLLDQEALMGKQKRLAVDPSVVSSLGVIHLTAAPPFVRSVDGILGEMRWLWGRLKSIKGVNILPRLKYMFKNINGEIVLKPGLNISFGLQNSVQYTDLHRLSELYNAGIAISGIAYGGPKEKGGENEYGGGFNFPNTPLTLKGQELLLSMAKTGMITDLSHSGYRTAWDALNLINKDGFRLPVIATHSGCAAVYDHLRNFPDDLLVAIKSSGGIVGIPTATFLLDKKDDSLYSFFRHLAHALNLLGEDHLAIGSDGIYKYIAPETSRQIYDTMCQKIGPAGLFGARWPDQPPQLNRPSRASVLKIAIRREFGEKIADKVCGDNALAFFKKAARVCEFSPVPVAGGCGYW